MIRLAREYMQAMNIEDTQYIVARHTDTAHPHLHIVYNRVRYDTKLVPDGNERRRNTAVCKALKRKYGLTFSKGKENIQTERLHEPDKTKQEIYAAVNAILPAAVSISHFAAELSKRGITLTLVHRGNDPDKEIQGATFTKDGTTFKASQIDRRFSYLKIVKRITENAQKQRQLTMITTIKGHTLTPDEQRRLYSAEGLTTTYTENGWLYRSTFRVSRTPAQHILTEQHLSQKKDPARELHVPSIHPKRSKGRKL